MRRPTTAALALIALFTLGLVGGCAGTDDADESSGDAGGAVGERIADEGAGGSGDDVDAEAPGSGGDLGAQAPPEENAERIVYTADLRVRVDDPAVAAAEAVELVEAAGGSLAAMTESEGADTVSVTVRVPVDGFRSALDALAELGTVLDRHVEAKEVTDQIVDLEGRLENARASADRLRELYATAGSVEQVVAVEQALTQREAEVESLAGQLQQLEDRADRSTIIATYVDEGEPVADEEPDDDSAFVDGLQAAGAVLAALATAIAALTGFALPFLPFVLVPALAVWIVVRIRRRRARRRTTPDAEEPIDA